MSYGKPPTSLGLLPPRSRSLLRNAASLTAWTPYPRSPRSPLRCEEKAEAVEAEDIAYLSSEHISSEPSTSDSESQSSAKAPSLSTSQASQSDGDRSLDTLLRKVFGDALDERLGPELFDFERTLSMNSPSGAHQHIVIEICDSQRPLFTPCIFVIRNVYKITLGVEQMKELAGPILAARQTKSTMHIPDIVIKITYMDGEYEVGVIEVAFSETWKHFIGRMLEYQRIATQDDDPFNWPVYIGGVKIFEHTKFKRPKLTPGAGYDKQRLQWKNLPLTALTELPENEVVPEGGEVVEEDVNEEEDPAPSECDFILTRPIMANNHVWCGELSAWFALFDVSRFLTDDERKELNNGLNDGLSMEEWAKLGYVIVSSHSMDRFLSTQWHPQPVQEKYDNYPKDRYDMFCGRWRRVFTRARFEVWRKGCEDWDSFKEDNDEANIYQTTEEVRRAYQFTNLGEELLRQLRQQDEEDLPEEFQLPFPALVEAIRHGAKCCARNRLQTFKRRLPGETAFNHTTLGRANFKPPKPVASLTDDAFVRWMSSQEAGMSASLARVRQREEREDAEDAAEEVNADRRRRPRRESPQRLA
ncbi:uncharacterized protein B0H18DRAFT_960653 [Fomitopsis serialis]|uniref:uncharacterized protein n=1 Tax=Fomitopsis serialis TaxID=139415 RepID=UPI0020088C9B|nr:uncharacterized protein B0H18DRAFT_960653 [Neoantrodia serialis]KAH9913047.1 hypothetical protein B0H18DRAFT_960653 [Neoantrodia serialis]